MLFLKNLFFYCLVFIVSPVFAGSWKVTITGSGTATADASPSKTWVAPADGVSVLSAFGNGGPGSSSMNVTINVLLAWQPDNSIPGGDPSPPFITIEEGAECSYTAVANGYPFASASGSASNGLGDPKVITSSNTQTGPPAHQSENGTSANTFVNRHFTTFNGNVSFSRTFSASGSSSGGGGSSASLVRYGIRIHAQPYDWKLYSHTINPDGTLTFTYRWKSTSGSILDLGHCEMHERVNYPGGDPYYPPFPFLPFGYLLSNPTVSSPAPMTEYLGSDTHQMFPYTSPILGLGATFTANQRYEYDDTETGENNVLIPGSDTINTITRTITNNRVPYSSDIWWQSITKHGFTGWKQIQ